MIVARLARLALLITALAVPAAAGGGPPSLDLIRNQGFEVTNLQGKPVPLASLLQSGRPVLLEFWATWCAPCRKTLPHLAELDRRFRDQGLVVVGLTVEDPASDLAKVQRFVQDAGMDFEVAFAPPALYRFVNNKESLGVPKILVFDAQGTVTEYVTSYTPLTNRHVEGAVRRVMAASQRNARSSG